MFVKICGLRTAQDVVAAAEAGADAVGFVLTTSARQVRPEDVRRLVGEAPAGVLTVAVFGAEPVAHIAAAAAQAGVSAIQLHGDHPPSAFAALRATGLTLIRATAAATAPDAHSGEYGDDLLILDSTTPGSGAAWDWSGLDTGADRGRWMLAGGLHPDNVAAAVAAARPW